MPGLWEDGERESGNPPSANMERQLSPVAKLLEEQEQGMGNTTQDQLMGKVRSLCHITREMTGILKQYSIRFHNG